MYRIWILLIVVSIALIGCDVIESPIYRVGKDDVIFDEDLLGIWEMTDDEKVYSAEGLTPPKLQFERKPNTSQYRIKLVDDPDLRIPESLKIETWNAFLVKVGDRTILDVVSETQHSLGHDFYLLVRNSKENSIELRQFAKFKIKSTENPLDWEERPLIADLGDVGTPLKLPVRVGKDGIRVKSDTESLRSFLKDAPIETWFPHRMAKRILAKSS
jgi:hypothetical protein